MLDKYHSQYRNLLKSYKARKDKPSFKAQMDRFIDNSKLLFDIAACKCASKNCTCAKEKKVPQRELTFLFDQRNERKMAISNIDHKTTTQLQRKEKRKETELKRQENEPEPSTSNTI